MFRQFLLCWNSCRRHLSTWCHAYLRVEFRVYSRRYTLRITELIVYEYWQKQIDIYFCFHNWSMCKKGLFLLQSLSFPSRADHGVVKQRVEIRMHYGFYGDPHCRTRKIKTTPQTRLCWILVSYLLNSSRLSRTNAWRLELLMWSRIKEPSQWARNASWQESRLSCVL